MELIGIFFAASGLLVVAGAAKALRPDDTGRALVVLLSGLGSFVPSLAVTRQIVKLVAVVEAAIGVCALLFPRAITAGLVAVSYGLFVVIVLVARQRGGPLATCGCFGRPDTPATGSHVFFNLVFVATACAVAIDPPGVTSVTTLLGRQPWDGLPLLLASGAGVWLTYLALAPLASLEAARQLVRRSSRSVGTQ